MATGSRSEAPRVLVVEDDVAFAGLLHAALYDEGYAVSVLGVVAPGAVRLAVGRLEPDCVLLEGESPKAYGSSWDTAAALRARARPVPVVMLTAQAPAAAEARRAATPRSRAAGLAGVVDKPFVLDDLLTTVADAAGSSLPLGRATGAEPARTAALVEKLRVAGALDVRASTRREWAEFYAPDGARRIVYGSRRDEAYYLLRQAPGSGTMQQIGRFRDLDVALALTLGVVPG
jgi:CheY-like chemotaxis protein